jgi:hypothetical protein
VLNDNNKILATISIWIFKNGAFNADFKYVGAGCKKCFYKNLFAKNLEKNLEKNRVKTNILKSHTGFFNKLFIGTCFKSASINLK